MKTIEDLQKEKLEAEIEKIKEETAQIKHSYFSKEISNDKIGKYKVKAEIEKLKEETALIKKPWYIQPSFLNLMVSFSVPILSLLAAYYIGGGKEYFDAKTISLQNQKFALEQDISKFKDKKDSLNLLNIELAQYNKNLTINQNKLQEEREILKSDTIRLGRITRENNRKMVHYDQQKESLLNELNVLSSQSRNLSYEIDKKNNELAQASFNEYYHKLINPKNVWDLKVNSAPFSELVAIVNEGKEFRQKYLGTIRSTIDTTKNFQLKAVLQAFMFTCTSEPVWKKDLFTTATNFCNEINGRIDKYTFGNPYFWKIFDEITWKSKSERIEIINFLVGCIKKMSENQQEGGNILTSVGFLNEYSNDLELYSNSPDNFCYLLKFSSKIAHSNILDNDGALYFLDSHAPIAYVVIVSEILSDPRQFSALSPYSRSQMIGRITGLIDRNSDVFYSEPTDVSSSNSWKEWRKKYIDLVQLMDNISTKDCDKNQLKKIIGKRIV